MVEPVAEHLAGAAVGCGDPTAPHTGDAEAAGIGEVRQCHAPRPEFRDEWALTEDHIPRLEEWGRTVQRPPVPNPTFPEIAGGAPDAVVSEALGMQLLQVTQQRHRLDRGLALEDRQQILFPDLGQRVRAKSFGNGRPRSILPDHPTGAMAGADRRRCPPAIALGGALAEAGAGGGGALAVDVAIMPVEAHLLVVDGVVRDPGRQPHPGLRRNRDHERTRTAKSRATASPSNVPQAVKRCPPASTTSTRP